MIYNTFLAMLRTLYHMKSLCLNTEINIAGVACDHSDKQYICASNAGTHHDFLVSALVSLHSAQ